MPDADGPVDERRPTALDLLVFLDELLLLAVLAVAGARIGTGVALSIALAVVLPSAVAALWGQWLAPRATRRLRHPARLYAKLGLVVLAAGLLAATGVLVWAVVFLVGSAALLTWGELADDRTGATS